MGQKHILWASVILLGYLHVALPAYLRCYKSSIDDYDVVPLNEAASLLNSTCYQSNRTCNLCYTFGYRGETNGSATNTSISALLTQNCNIFLLDWEQEASSIELLGTVSELLTYPTTSIVQVTSVGNQCGEALISMAKSGLNLSETHLIGHSLGAHLFGFTGRKVESEDMQIARITGLEPARPFYETPPVEQPLDKNCAKFVDCVHTDYGGYGVNTSYCLVDIYVNKTVDNVQPGCPVGNFVPLSDNALCSHTRCVQLFADALKYPMSLVGCSAANYSEWVSGHGNTQNNAYIGRNVNETARGNYYIRVTNSESPYGQGRAGLNPY